MAGKKRQSSTEAARFADDLTRVCPDMAGGPLLLAVSGGPDSMAMLTLAAEAIPGGFTVATVDHGLRPDSAREAKLVADYCAGIGVPHATLLPSEAIEGASIQAQARDRRYALLAAHAKAIGASCIATAHHADDQAETFLMRAARGSGLAGLCGVRPRLTIAGAMVVRPLLDWRRAELRAIARRAGAPFIDDPSNSDTRHDRTRFRQLLDANEWLDPPHIARSATALAEADSDMRAIVDWLWNAHAEIEEDGIRIVVRDLPREVRRRLARRAIGHVRESGGISRPDWTEATNIEALLNALALGKRATQAGVIGSSRQDVWRFRPAPPRR